MHAAASTQDQNRVDSDQNDCQLNQVQISPDIIREGLAQSPDCEELEPHILGLFVQLVDCLDQIVFEHFVELFFNVWVSSILDKVAVADRLSFLKWWIDNAKSVLLDCCGHCVTKHCLQIESLVEVVVTARVEPRQEEVISQPRGVVMVVTLSVVDEVNQLTSGSALKQKYELEQSDYDLLC